ncbi:MAG: TonB-dependent receptor [Vicinamibacterales bacterium]|nr:TonB-dependent receptor [Vicinamibacterales bacterium]
MLLMSSPGIRSVLCVAAAWWAGTVPVASQSSPPPVLETVVVTGSAVPVMFRELPRTVRVITREDIERLPANSVTDLIRLVASVDVRARGPRGVQADFGVRGAGFGQVLVLLDGVRLNNAQTGHHNSDLPVTLDEIERIEVLLGPGSSAFGADAFGGTVNLITRRGAGSPGVSATLGEHGVVDAGATAGFRSGGVEQRVAARASRSSGFMFDRDFRTVTFSSSTRLGTRTRATAGLVDKAFGANGFYGDSPSREWTTLWTAAVDHGLIARDRLQLGVRASYRTHQDRFLWDVRHPGVFESTHRTHGAQAAVNLHWRVSAATDVGAVVETAGDWIRSSNLGDHTEARSAVALDVQHRVDDTTVVQGAVRADVYSTFGTAASPSVGVSRWLGPAWRARASAGRAFRVPTFTERYYRDPVHAATATLAPERAWAVEAGLDWLPSPAWQATAGVFRRWERGVIDWVRPDATAVWRTTNIRDVAVSGFETGVRRAGAQGRTLAIDYTWLAVNAGTLALQSKYTLDYARHSLVVSGSLRVAGAFDAGVRVEGRDRIARAPYVLTDLRLSRLIGRARVFVDASNLLGVRYEEVRGVAMPGRWVTVGVEVGK